MAFVTLWRFARRSIVVRFSFALALYLIRSETVAREKQPPLLERRHELVLKLAKLIFLGVGDPFVDLHNDRVDDVRRRSELLQLLLARGAFHRLLGSGAVDGILLVKHALLRRRGFVHHGHL